MFAQNKVDLCTTFEFLRSDIADITFTLGTDGADDYCDIRRLGLPRGAYQIRNYARFHFAASRTKQDASFGIPCPDPDLDGGLEFVFSG